MSAKNIKLTDYQKKVLDDLLSFAYSPTDRVFILKGYAGTGKTTLMRFFTSELRKKKKPFRLLASTGRAAKILSNLADAESQATTIHSMIYSFNGLNRTIEDKVENEMDKNGQLFLSFSPQTIDSESSETIYIIDEASMISDVELTDVTQAKFGSGRLLSELLNYDQRPLSKYIFVGDPCQLPPIEEYYSPALMPSYFEQTFKIKPRDAELTEIMRQDNDLIIASKTIRDLYTGAPNDESVYGTRVKWGKIYLRQYNNIVIHSDQGALLNDYIAKIKKYGHSNATFICQSNSQCHKQSVDIRQRLGMPDGRLAVGDLLMVVQNNIPTGLMNGDMVKVLSISDQYETHGGITFREVKVVELFSERECSALMMMDLLNQPQPNLNSTQQYYLFVDFVKRMERIGIKQKDVDKFNHALMSDPYLNAIRSNYGYAITCHKSQGGEWDEAYLMPARNITKNPTKGKYQWLYTAMTRARNTLHMADDFFIA